MPYADKMCAACDARGNYYHNVVKCRKCGKEKLVAKMRFEQVSGASERRENGFLRAEVNALRAKLGMGVKYVDYGRKPTK